MGYDFGNASDQHAYLNLSSWPVLLRIAHENGWKPRGTTACGIPGLGMPDTWEGSYTGNDGQYIEPEDCLRLAEALERAANACSSEEKLSPETLRSWADFLRQGPVQIF